MKEQIFSAEAQAVISAAKAEHAAAAKARKEAEKAAEQAEKEAAKEYKTKKAAEAAKKAAKAAKEKAEAAKEAEAAALNKVSTAQEAAQKEAEAEAAKKAARLSAVERLTQGTKQEARGLNAIYRAAKDAAAKEGSTEEEKAQRQEERARLLELAGVDVKEGQEITAADVEAVPVSALISAYKRAARYIIAEEEGRSSIAVLVRTQAGANVWRAEKAQAYSPQDLIKGAYVRLILKKEQPQQVEEGAKYEKGAKGVIKKLSAAEAKRREIAARDAAAQEAKAKAEEEAQAAADREAGRSAREAAEAKARRAAERGEARSAEEIGADIEKAAAKVQEIAEEAAKMQAAAQGTK